MGLSRLEEWFKAILEAPQLCTEAHPLPPAFYVEV